MSPRKKMVFQTTFTTYTAGDVIDEGGAGRIYEAVDGSGYKWAIKLLDSKKATRDKTKRFKNELMFCFQNRHPNILTVIDHGLYVNGQTSAPFYVMPRYDGSLRTLLKTGISADRTLHYFSNILDGTEAAHLLKVVHRDLKPENILYDANNDRLLIADFGIAHFEEEDLVTAVETKDSVRLANFQYAAPEQRARGSKSDHRADIFALGLILNEMFTRQVPYGMGFKTIGQSAPDYAYLDDLVEQMLRQSPEERFPSIEAIKEQLIGRREKFITRQRISELKNTVVPTTELDDPLIDDPPHLVGFDWKQGVLTLVLNQPVNAAWLSALHHMGSYQCVQDKPPTAFSFSGNRATIRAQENEVQDVINHFKRWLPQANTQYTHKIRQEKEKIEAAKRQQLQHEIAQQEARQRVLNNTKI